MNNPTHITDFSKLKKGQIVWIIFIDYPQSRYFVDAEYCGFARLAEKESLIDKRLYLDAVWKTKKEVLEYILIKARNKLSAIQEEIFQLEKEISKCKE